MNHKSRWIVIGACALAVVAGGATIAVAAATNADQTLAGNSLDKATAAALSYTHGGTVTESEVGDDGAAFEVGVRLDNGRQLEVTLDADFTVIDAQADDDGSHDVSGSAND